MSIFNEDFVFEFKGKKYEYLGSDFQTGGKYFQFRVILSENDYDYIDQFSDLHDELYDRVDELWGETLYEPDVSLSCIVEELESELRDYIGDDIEWCEVRFKLMKAINKHK